MLGSVETLADKQASVEYGHGCRSSIRAVSHSVHKKKEIYVMKN